MRIAVADQQIREVSPDRLANAARDPRRRRESERDQTADSAWPSGGGQGPRGRGAPHCRGFRLAGRAHRGPRHRAASTAGGQRPLHGPQRRLQERRAGCVPLPYSNMQDFRVWGGPRSRGPLAGGGGLGKGVGELRVVGAAMWKLRGLDRQLFEGAEAKIFEFLDIEPSCRRPGCASRRLLDRPLMHPLECHCIAAVSLDEARSGLGGVRTDRRCDPVRNRGVADS
jgi:hypothetical protein